MTRSSHPTKRSRQKMQETGTGGKHLMRVFELGHWLRLQEHKRKKRAENRDWHEQRYWLIGI